jgi:hypothetical protein
MSCAVKDLGQRQVAPITIGTLTMTLNLLLVLFYSIYRFFVVSRLGLFFWYFFARFNSAIF